jgi:hypothetical protein
MAKTNGKEGLYDKSFFERRIASTENRIEELRQELMKATVSNFEEIAGRLRAAQVKLEAQKSMLANNKGHAVQTHSITKKNTNQYAN